MPRPSQPLLSRESIVAAALHIMDRDGLAAFSLPRLGEELKVRTPSLYYHFRDRAELLAEVARQMVRGTRMPSLQAKADGADWTDWFVELALNFRRAILEHRNAAPILLQFLPRDVMVTLYENAALLLHRSQRVAMPERILLLDGLEKLTLGTIMVDAMREPGETAIFANVDPTEHPRLSEALEANVWSGEELFAEAVRAFLRGLPKDGHRLSP